MTDRTRSLICSDSARINSVDDIRELVSLAVTKEPAKTCLRSPTSMVSLMVEMPRARRRSSCLWPDPGKGSQWLRTQKCLFLFRRDKAHA